MNRFTPSLVAATVVALTVTATTALAATVARYDMEDGTNSTSSATTHTDDADVVNGSFITSAGDLTEAGTSNNFWHWDGSAASMVNSVDGDAWVIQQNHIDAVPGSTDTAKDYLEFTLTGLDMDLTADLWKLVVSMAMRNTAGTNAQAGLNLQADVGAGFVTIADMQADAVPSIDGTPDFKDFTWDLSTLGDDITSATFRLFATEAVNSNVSTKLLFIDTISVTAEVPVPAALPAGLGLIGLLAARRRTHT